MRAGFGEERRELHSTHSMLGKLAVFLVLVFAFGWVVLSWDLSMSIDIHFQSTMYGWQFFMGGWVVALMIHSILVRLWRNSLGAEELIQRAAFPRHREAVLRASRRSGATSRSASTSSSGTATCRKRRTSSSCA